ncbi:MAG: hypothetical protein WBN48_08455 [Thiogranum sp.]
MKRHCMLRPEHITPSQDDVKVVGVFNPGAVRVGEKIYLLVRVAEGLKRSAPDEKCIVFPRAVTGCRRQSGSGYRIEPFERRKADCIEVDSRVYKTKRDGWLLLTTISHFRLVKVELKPDGNVASLDISDEPTFFPEKDYEQYGIEDARITKIELAPDECWYYITYVAVSPHGAVTALARTQDFVVFERLGIIFPVENKDVVLFPKGEGDRPYRVLHRPLAAYPFGPIEMWLAESPDLSHWGNNLPLGLDGDFLQPDPQETSPVVGPRVLRVGGGTPPVPYDEPGHWLEIYHAALADSDGDHIGRYCALAVVLDRGWPHSVHRAARRILFEAEEDFERQGFVPNVVFPTGVVKEGDDYIIFYGAADENVGMTVISRQEIEDSLVRE